MTNEPADKKVKRMLDRYRMTMAAQTDAFRSQTDQRAAGVRKELLEFGVTDLVQAALGWRWATQSFLDQCNIFGFAPPPVLVQALDNMLATGMAIIDEETRKAEATTTLIIPGEEPE